MARKGVVRQNPNTKACSRTKQTAVRGLISGGPVTGFFETSGILVPVFVLTNEWFLLLFFLDRLFFSDLSYLVIDEADSMFDSSFKSDTMEILQSISVSRHVPSYIFLCIRAWRTHSTSLTEWFLQGVNLQPATHLVETLWSLLLTLKLPLVTKTEFLLTISPQY